MFFWSTHPHKPCPRPAQWRYDQAGLGYVLGLVVTVVASHEGVRAEGPEASLLIFFAILQLYNIAIIRLEDFRFPTDRTPYPASQGRSRRPGPGRVPPPAPAGKGGRSRRKARCEMINKEMEIRRRLFNNSGKRFALLWGRARVVYITAKCQKKMQNFGVTMGGEFSLIALM